MSDNRKRPVPSDTPDFPSKKANHLPYQLNRLSLNNDEALSTFGSQHITPRHHMPVEPHTIEMDQAANAMEISRSIPHAYHEQSTFANEPYTSNQPQMILSRIGHPTIQSSLAEAFSKHNPLPLIRKYTTDPRDIKSNDTQRRYSQAIAEYLDKIGFKEFVPQYRTNRSLSSKDFHYIYTHLVQHYDPSLRNRRKIEDHVIEIMNSLKYPLRDSISRKSLLSIGAIHSNANFYGLLHWLMAACKSRDVSNPKEFKDPTVANLEIEENAMSSAFADFSIASYRKYISSKEEPTYEEEINPLRNRFDAIAEERRRDVHELDTEIAALKEEVAMLESDGSTIENLKKRNHDLTRDIAKFRNYCNEKRKRVEKYRSINKVVEDEVKRLVNEIQILGQQKAELEEKFKGKNLSLASLKSLAKEHEEEMKKCADLTAHLETRLLAYNEQMQALTILRDRVRQQVDEFNTKVKKLFPLDPEQHAFLLVYNPGATVANEMLSYDVDQKLIPTLERLATSERQDFDKITIETQRAREKTDIVNADIEQKELDLIKEQKEVEIKAKTYEETRRKFMEENDKYNIMTEKHEKALDDERGRSRGALLQAKERLFAEETRLNKMRRRFQQEQEELVMTKRLMVAHQTDFQADLILKLNALRQLVVKQCTQ